MFLDHQALDRQRRRIADSLARARKHGAGGKPEVGLVLLRETCTEVLGVEFSVLSMLDVKSAVELLGSTERVVAFAQLVEAMAALESGDVARKRYEHAFQLAAVQREKKGFVVELDELISRIISRL